MYIGVERAVFALLTSQPCLFTACQRLLHEWIAHIFKQNLRVCHVSVRVDYKRKKNNTITIIIMVKIQFFYNSIQGNLRNPCVH